MLKSAKRLLEENDVFLNWKKINRRIPPASKHGRDRAPKKEEIRRLLKDEDLRVKIGVLLMMSSGGLRIGAFDDLRVGDVQPIYNDDGSILCAKVKVYPEDPEEYYTFITPEAYQAVQEYLEFRRQHGEKIARDSPLLIHQFRVADREACLKRVKVKPLKASGLKRLIERALWKHGIRREKKKRHEFQADHGFRKFFKTRAEQVMKHINVEILMGHSTGVSDSYYKPTMKELLEDYVKAIPLLTINEVYELKQENLRLKNKNTLKEVEEIKEELARLKGIIDTALIAKLLASQQEPKV